MVLEILGLFTSGGALGGLMGLGKKWLADRHEAKMLNIKVQERAKDREHDLALADKEIQRDMQASADKLTQTMFEADTIALSTASASQDLEISALDTTLDGAWGITKNFAAFLFTLVTVSQKMVRIVLTVALVYQTFVMFDQVGMVLGGMDAIPVAEQIEIYKHIVYSIVALTGTAVGFWFVSRPEKNKPAA